MKTSWTVLSLIALTSTLGGCASNTEEAAATDDADIVGGSSFAAIESTFALTEGTAREEDLRNGSCYRMLVAPVDGIPNFRMKKFANGTIVFPADGEPTHSICVDVYGENAMSADGLLLDTILRYGFGRLVSVDSARGSSKMTFEKGEIVLFNSADDYTSGGRPFLKTPDELPIGSGMTLAGTIERIVRKDVLVTGIGGERRDDFEIDVETASILHRWAWQNAVREGHGAMETDTIGTFDGKAVAISDVCCGFTTIGFSTGATIRYDLGMDESSVIESVRIFRPFTTAAALDCERRYASDSPQPAYACERH